ncbi:MAG: hypothetical protein H7839_17600 [Magnetococcus sp. YQC-5]
MRCSRSVAARAAYGRWVAWVCGMRRWTRRGRGVAVGVLACGWGDKEWQA